MLFPWATYTECGRQWNGESQRIRRMASQNLEPEDLCTGTNGFFFFHDSDGKNWGPERGYIQFILELGLEAKPAHLDGFSSLAPGVSNKGMHMNLEVRHSQAEMSPITGWLLWCRVVNAWPQREAEVSAVMRCEFPPLFRGGESSEGRSHDNTRIRKPHCPKTHPTMESLQVPAHSQATHLKEILVSVCNC